MGLLYAKENRVDLLPFEHNARTWQTDKQADHGTVTLIAIGEIAFSMSPK